MEGKRGTFKGMGRREGVKGMEERGEGRKDMEEEQVKEEGKVRKGKKGRN